MDSNMAQSGSNKPDQGWAWVILIATFLSTYVSAGLVVGSGVYVNAIIENWHVSHAVAALAGSIQLAIFHCAGAPRTLLITWISHRSVILGATILTAAGLVVSANVSNLTLLYVFYAALSGLCAGVVFIQSMVMVNLYFDRYKSMASGITLSGIGLAILLTPIFERHLIDIFGWQPSFYIMAGIILQSCVFGMLMRPIKTNGKNTETEQSQYDSKANVTIVQNCADADHTHKLRRKAIISLKETCPCEMWNNIKFVLFLFSNTLWSIGFGVLTVLVPNLYSESKMKGHHIDISLALIGVGNVSGSLLCGFLLNVLTTNYVLAHIIMTVIMGISIGMHVIRTEFAMFAAAGLLYGLMSGGSIVTRSLITRQLAGIKNYASGYSAVCGFCAVGFIVGPPLSGLIYDVTKSYQWAFITTGAMVVGSGLLLIPIMLICKLEGDNQDGASETCNTESIYSTNRFIKPSSVINDKGNNTIFIIA